MANYRNVQKGAACLDTLHAASPALPDVEEERRKKTVVTILIELCEEVELFRDHEMNAYAVVRESGCQQVWNIDSKPFHFWLSKHYYELTKQGVSTQSISDALNTVKAKAFVEGPAREVFMRVAFLGDRIYIDLADEQWRVVEIDASGWRVLDISPVMFIRRPGMAALPYPEPGDLNDLARYVNVGKEGLKLMIGWLLMAARGKGPFPILAVQGEHGTGKSNLTKRLRTMIDPSSVPLRGLSRDVRNLMVTATNNHVIVLDNLSGLTTEFSDVLCRLATGGGFAERELYSNREEVIIDIARPIILNGIDAIATRGDLMERCLMLELPPIPDHERQGEDTLERLFEEARPKLLGGLCEALKTGLQNLPHTKLERKPRMADFCLWAVACSPALGWGEGEFMTTYRRNQDANNESVMEGCPFTVALVVLMEKRTRWSGTATELLHELNGIADSRVGKSTPWPKTGKGVANVLQRMAPLLRNRGISITKGKREGADGRRIIEITKAPQESSEPSASSEMATTMALQPDGEPTKDIAALPGSVGVSSAIKSNAGAAIDDADVSDDAFQESFSSNIVAREI